MAEVFAGFVCGYALALLVTPVAAVVLIRTPTGQTATGGTLPRALSVASLSVVLHMFAFIALTAIGLLLGMLLYGLEDSRPSGGLGSPNATFTGLIIGITAIAVVPMAIVVPRWRAPLLASGLVFAAIFGWAMPWLSLAGPEG